MNERQKLDEFREIVNRRLDQLNDIISVSIRHMGREINSDAAMREIEQILMQENR